MFLQTLCAKRACLVQRYLDIVLLVRCLARSPPLGALWGVSGVRAGMSMRSLLLPCVLSELLFFTFAVGKDCMGAAIGAGGFPGGFLELLQSIGRGVEAPNRQK